MMILNEPQQKAVEHVDGPALVIAGAGSGKTRVVTQRIVRLLEKGVPSSQILGVTFTNKAAGEMRDRVKKSADQHVLISTFHSLGVRILRESIASLGYCEDFTIYDEDDALKLIRECLISMAVIERDAKPKFFKGLISKAKNDLLAPSDIDTTALITSGERLFPQVYTLYQEKLKECNALDFDDLLYLTVRLLREHKDVLERLQQRWRYLLVDEYQDTNIAQYHMIRMLVEKTHNLFVVGDPDQSIYSWRGATIANIMNFEHDYPHAVVVSLEQNYRSTTTILTAANALIRNNGTRYDKHLWSGLGEGEKISFYHADDDRDEARYVVENIVHHQSNRIPLNDMVIFYRTNFQSRSFEDMLLKKNIPYIIVGGTSFYQRREIKDVMAFLRVAYSSSDFVSFARTINIPKRGLGDTTLAKIRFASEVAQIPIYDYCKSLIRGEVSIPHARISQRQRDGLSGYIAIIEELRRMMREDSLSDLVSSVVRVTGYLDVIRADRETFEDRKQNLEELISKASEWEREAEVVSLRAFLEELSLKSNLDETTSQGDKISLMTVHNGKGLEFPVVFVVGLEEGLFPHANSQEDFNALEEERRLCYVAITRARSILYLTAAQCRTVWGTFRSMRKSRFIQELPANTIKKATKWRREEEPRYVIDDEYSEHTRRKLIFSVGDGVYHDTFGAGVVTATYYRDFGLICEVFFEREGRSREIATKYGKIKKL